MLARFTTRLAIAVGLALVGGGASGQELPPRTLPKIVDKSPDTTTERVQEIPLPVAPQMPQPAVAPPPAPNPPRASAGRTPGSSRTASTRAS